MRPCTCAVYPLRLPHGMPADGAELVRVAAHLDDRPEGQIPRAVVAVRPHPPHAPRPLVVGQVAVGDGDELAGGGGAAGEGEQANGVAGEQGVRVPGLHPLDVRGEPLIRGDGYPPAVVGDGADVGEPVIGAERGARLPAEGVQQQFGLHPLRVFATPQKATDAGVDRQHRHPRRPHHEVSQQRHAEIVSGRRVGRSGSAFKMAGRRGGRVGSPSRSPQRSPRSPHDPPYKTPFTPWP